MIYRFQDVTTSHSNLQFKTDSYWDEPIKTFTQSCVANVNKYRQCSKHGVELIRKRCILQVQPPKLDAMYQNFPREPLKPGYSWSM